MLGCTFFILTLKGVKCIFLGQDWTNKKFFFDNRGWTKPDEARSASRWTDVWLPLQTSWSWVQSILYKWLFIILVNRCRQVVVTLWGVCLPLMLPRTMMTKPQEASTANPSYATWLCRCVTLATTFVITGNASHTLCLTIKIPEIIWWHLTGKKEHEFCRHCAETGWENSVPILSHKLLCPLP